MMGLISALYAVRCAKELPIKSGLSHLARNLQHTGHTPPLRLALTAVILNANKTAAPIKQYWGIIFPWRK